MRVVKVHATGSVAARIAATMLVILTSLVAAHTSAQMGANDDPTHDAPSADPSRETSTAEGERDDPTATTRLPASTDSAARSTTFEHPHDLTNDSITRSTTFERPHDLTTASVARSTRAFDDSHDLTPLLTESRVRARRWHRAWALTFAIGLVAQGVLVGLASDRDERLANLFGAIPPLTGLAIQLASPLASLREPPLDEAPELTLARYARSEAGKRNWFAHVGPIFLNLAVAAVQLFAFDRPLNAGLQVGLGITLSQTQLWTSPRIATNALR